MYLLSIILSVKNYSVKIKNLEPIKIVHGVLVEIKGLGVLIMGESGIGKSECALDLIMRGNRLIADDVVEIYRKRNKKLMGRGHGMLKNYLEIRGVGIINIKEMFGKNAIKDEAEINLIIELVRWKEGEEYDRLGMSRNYYNLCNNRIPYMRIPVTSGRNMATIVEIAARNLKLMNAGKDSVAQIEKMVKEEIEKRRKKQ